MAYIQLDDLNRKLQQQCFMFSQRVNDINSSRNKLEGWELKYLTEGLIHDLWQAWVSFNRCIILSSCRGAIARDGLIVTGVNRVDNSWQRIGYEGQQLSNGNSNLRAGRRITYVRQEPNWGDIDKCIDIIGGVSISNISHLQSVYGSYTSPKHLQKVRNTCAHVNVETMSNLRSDLLAFYSSPLTNAAYSYAWSSPLGRNIFSLEYWIAEISELAELATDSG